ncbi:hypothetical protein X975_17825, partial [Stegodyphus mimosarum]
MSGFPAATNTHNLQTSNQEIRMVCCAQKCPMANHKLTTTTVATKPVANCVNTVRQTVPPTINNIATPTATFTFKAPVGTVVLPNCSTANALLSSKVAEHQKVHPVLVVPSPSNRSVDGPQTGVLLNLVPPPIRVPQYPPPLPRTPAPIKTQIVSNCIPVTTTNTPTPISSSLDNSTDPASGSSTASTSPVNSVEKFQPPPSPEKIN